MKVYIDTDEYYPYYILSETFDKWSVEVDVDRYTYNRWVKAVADFRQAMNEIEKVAATAYEMH